MQYFRNQDWPEECIDEALRLIRSEWFSCYKTAPTSATASTAMSENPATSASVSGVMVVKASHAAMVSFYLQSCSVAHANHAPNLQTQAMFASLAPGAASCDADALEVYLEAPPLSSMDDLLEYWNVRVETDKGNSLARMAIDFLSIPGTSETQAV